MCGLCTEKEWSLLCPIVLAVVDCCGQVDILKFAIFYNLSASILKHIQAKWMDLWFCTNRYMASIWKNDIYCKIVYLDMASCQSLLLSTIVLNDYIYAWLWCTSVHTYVYVCVYICVYACVYVCMCVCMCVSNLRMLRLYDGNVFYVYTARVECITLCSMWGTCKDIYISC